MTAAGSVDLSGGVAVITGAAGGIGLGLARACATRAMRLVLADLDGDRLAAAEADLTEAGATVATSVVDVSNAAELEALRDLAVSRFGAVDLVCNNAGVGLAKPLLDCTTDDWRLLLEVNVGSVANGIAAFLPLLVEADRGHLMATSSLSGLVADPGLGVYNATKFAVAGVMEALASELASTSVSASVLCPGPVATGLLETSATLTGVAAAPEVADYLAAGMDPDTVGALAIEGVEAGRFWLLTHPELTERLVRGRTEAMLTDGSIYVDPVDWTEQTGSSDQPHC